jgi:hypothetical protein
MASYLRTPEETWLQRHARPILVFLSSLGVLLTAYLTYTKLTEQPAAFCGGMGGVTWCSPVGGQSFWGSQPQPLACWGF